MIRAPGVHQTSVAVCAYVRVCACVTVQLYRWGVGESQGHTYICTALPIHRVHPRLQKKKKEYIVISLCSSKQPMPPPLSLNLQNWRTSKLSFTREWVVLFLARSSSLSQLFVLSLALSVARSLAVKVSGVHILCALCTQAREHTRKQAHVGVAKGRRHVR